VNSSRTATRLGDTSFSTERDPEDPSHEGTGAARTVLVAVGLLVFGTLYERTRDLAVPIVAHAVYNTLLLVLAFLAL
jgi:membrane protease YdiL (CAAX protease family)